MVIAKKLGAIDKPDGKRKIHTRPIPRLGGVAIFIGIFTGVLGGAGYLFLKHQAILLDPKNLIGIFIGSSFILLLGIADDFFSLKPAEKYLGQIAGSFLAIFFGFTISFLNLPTGGTLVLGYWSIPATIFWITAMINIMNFIDGLDGLAAGVAAIAGTSFLAYLLLKQSVTLALIVSALVGSTLAFLRYNFYPAKIFMGDSGSMLLGYLFGVISVNGVVKSLSAFSLLVPIVIMGVPVIDTFLAILRRASAGRPITEADSKHIHHSLLHRGFGHRGAVILIYFWSAALAVAGYVVSGPESDLIKIVVLAVAFMVTVAIVSYTGLIKEIRIVRNERRKK
jgi:UDP-GlcNAc:undecaprenyl-phosphate GlcNAc-1-phosphate transferase